MERKFGKNFKDQIIERIGIEKQKRSIIDSICVFSHYLLDYFILWALIGMRIQNYQSPLDNLIMFMIARGVLALLFFIVRHPIFFTLNKIVVLSQIMLVKENKLMESLVVLTPEVLMVTVWAINKDRRNYHFDSQIGFGFQIGKQLLIYI